MENNEAMLVMIVIVNVIGCNWTLPLGLFRTNFEQIVEEGEHNDDNKDDETGDKSEKEDDDEPEEEEDKEGNMWVGLYLR